MRTLSAAFFAAALLFTGQVSHGEIVAGWELPRDNDFFDIYAPTTTQVSPIQGWAYSTTPGATIKRLIDVYVEDELVMKVPCCGSRGDVAEANPGAPELSGFSAAVNWPIFGTGRKRIRIVIKSSVGEILELSRVVDINRWTDANRVKEMTWSTESEKGCEVFNSDIDEEGNETASIVITNMRMVTNSGVKFCTGDLDKFGSAGGEKAWLQWDSGIQGFRLDFGTCD